MHRQIEDLQAVLFLVFANYGGDRMMVKRLMRTASRHKIFRVSGSLEFLCDQIHYGSNVDAMQAGVNLALLFPRVSTSQWSKVERSLLRYLTDLSTTSKSEAAAYALQYSQSPRTIRLLQALSKSRSASKRLREIARESVGFEVSEQGSRARAR